MTELVAPGTRGREVKITTERMGQVKNLVERGKRPEEIAELIGVTVGSLQVTCSRLGISLRPPKFNTGVARLDRVSAAPSARPSAPVASAPSEANVAVLIRHRNKEQVIPLPLTQEMIGQLALEAEFRGMKVSDLIGELIMQAFGKRDPARYRTDCGWMRLRRADLTHPDWPPWLPRANVLAQFARCNGRKPKPKVSTPGGGRVGQRR